MRWVRVQFPELITFRLLHFINLVVLEVTDAVLCRPLRSFAAPSKMVHNDSSIWKSEAMSVAPVLQTCAAFDAPPLYST